MMMQQKLRMSPDEARMLYQTEREKRQRAKDAIIDEVRKTLREQAESGAGRAFTIGGRKRTTSKGHTCNACGKGPDETKFSRSSKTKSGLAGKCSPCTSAAKRRWEKRTGIVRKRMRFIMRGPYAGEWFVEDTAARVPGITRERFPTRALARDARDRLNAAAAKAAK